MYKSNPTKSSAMKIGEHIPCEYSISKIWTFDGIENKHNVYRGEHCIKRFCESLREHAIKIN